MSTVDVVEIEPEIVEVSLSIPEAPDSPIEVTYSDLVVVGTLDDAIGALFDRLSTHPDGIPEDELERVFLEVTGLDVTELFAHHVRGAQRESRTIPRHRHV